LDLTKHHINQPIELLVGAQFNSWAIAEHYIKEYGRQKGFVVNWYRVEHHKSYSTALNDRVKKRTYVYCKWHVNLSNPEASNFVHITLVDLEHNHILDADNIRFATAFRKFDESIMDKIERMVIYSHCDAYTIRNLLRPLFPDHLFLTQDLSNAIQKIKREKKVVGSDASHLL
ncbi:3677_t:CDS:2, partial [Dentiscutata erythropus]